MIATTDLEAYLDGLPKDDYLLTHRRRYLETYRRAVPYLVPSSLIVELGFLSPVTRYIRDSTACELREVTGDLRRTFDFPSEAADTVFCLEVLEHIHDLVDPGCSLEQLVAFRMSGAANLLSETHRILKKGGALIVTTPNANSVDVMLNVALKKPPFLYAPHVREYSIGEVTALATAAGFRSEVVDTYFAWEVHSSVLRDTFLSILEEHGFESSQRGDDLFLVLRKP